MINQEVRKQAPHSRRGGLGRGLASLLPAAFNNDDVLSEPREQEEPATPAPTEAEAIKRIDQSPYFYCPIEDIVPNPNQPRRLFDPIALEELAQSIQAHGLLSPIVVRRNGAHFEIIAGERRWRAAKKVGLKKVPVLLKEVGEKAQYQLALIENIQRANLSPIEEAMGFEHLMEAYGWTQEKVAEQVGKDRTTIANCLRLLKLPQSVIDMINHGKISVGHAKALLSLTETQMIREIAKKIVDEGWSVRMVEQASQHHKQGATKERITLRPDPLISSLQQKFEQTLKTRVVIHPKGSGGTLQVQYSSVEQLNKIAEALGVI